MKHSYTTVLFVLSLFGTTACDARPLCNDAGVLDTVYSVLNDGNIGPALGATSYETLSVVTYSHSPTDTECAVTVGLILRKDAPIPPGVTLTVPYIITDLNGEYRVSVNEAGISQGIDTTRFMQGLKSSNAPTPEEINKANGYDRNRAWCKAQLAFKPNDYGNSDPEPLTERGRQRLAKRAECRAKYPELVNHSQSEADALLQHSEVGTSPHPESDRGERVSTRISADGDEFTVNYNSSGAVLTSVTEKTFLENNASGRSYKEHLKLYLGKGCDAFSEVYGKGSWSWANGGFIVSYQQRTFSFPRQEISIPGEEGCLTQ
jgi:hypothetical protein